MQCSDTALSQQVPIQVGIANNSTSSQVHTDQHSHLKRGASKSPSQSS